MGGKGGEKPGGVWPHLSSHQEGDGTVWYCESEGFQRHVSEVLGSSDDLPAAGE